MTAENAAELVEGLASTLGDTIEQVQTKDNLDRVTSVLEDVVGLLDLGNFTVDESVREHVEICTFSSIIVCQVGFLIITLIVTCSI